MNILIDRQRWTQQPPYGGLIDSVPGVSFGASVLLPSVGRADLTALTAWPSVVLTPFGVAFRGNGSNAGIKVPTNINNYPYCLVAIAYFRDVTTNRIFSSLSTTTTTACRVQIDVNAGVLRHITVGSSTQTDSVSVSANKWYGIVCVGDSATSRRTYACDLAAGTVASSSNTTSATFPAAFTTFSALTNIYDSQPNGQSWIDADTPLVCWAQGNPPPDLAKALAQNPWNIFSA